MERGAKTHFAQRRFFCRTKRGVALSSRFLFGNVAPHDGHGNDWDEMEGGQWHGDTDISHRHHMMTLKTR